MNISAGVTLHHSFRKPVLVQESEMQDIISKLISRNDHTNSARSIDMTGHFHVLRCSLALEQTHFVNWGLVKVLNQILHHERIRHHCLWGHLLQRDAIN